MIRYNRQTDQPKKIAKTENSSVYRSRLDGNTVIIKKYISKDFVVALDQVLKEVNILLKIKHIGITSLLEIWPDDHLPTLVLEYGGQNLWDFSNTRSPHLRMLQFGEIFAQSFQALDYLHKNNIIHRDLKATNILIQMNDTLIPPKPIVKICDFGLARRMNGIMTPHTCTPNYRAPELLSGIYEEFDSTYSEKIDMWSMACVIYEYLTHDILFRGDSDIELWRKVMDCIPAQDSPYKFLPIPKGNWTPINKAFDKKYYGLDLFKGLLPMKNMTKQLLSLNPKDRPSSDECLIIINNTFGLSYKPSTDIIQPPRFLVRKTTRVDLNIRHVVVSNMISMENYYEVSRSTISLAVDIFDKWLMITDGNDDLILHSLAAAVLASYSSLTILEPVEFASTYTEADVISAVKSLFKALDYNLEFMDMWSLMLDTAKTNGLPVTEDHLDLYWYRVCELLLDYDLMFAKSQDEIRIVLDTIIV